MWKRPNNPLKIANLSQKLYEKQYFIINIFKWLILSPLIFAAAWKSGFFNFNKVSKLLPSVSEGKSAANEVKINPAPMAQSAAGLGKNNKQKFINQQVLEKMKGK